MSVTLVDLRTTGVAAGGDAVARDDGGRVVFVSGALPGERVGAEVVEEHASYAKARVVDVVDPAPGRIAPPCPEVARGCGGCGWQHVDPVTQRVLKAEIVADALRRQGGVADPVVDPGPDLPGAAYRTTLRLAVRPDGRVGFRRARSHDVVDVAGCLVAHPLLQPLVADGRFGGATEVTLRCGSATGEVLALVAPAVGDVELPPPHEGGAPLVVGADDLSAGHRAWYHEVVAGRRWRVSARSFFQARPDGAEALVVAVRNALGPVAAEGERLLDAYGGVGLFAGALGEGRRTTVVERSASSVADARVNLADRQARVLRLDVERWRPSPMELVVADPARSGLGKAAVRAVAASGARTVALVSCDPASLGRDAGLLARAGYRWRSTSLVDLFPHTPHVEAVSAFDRSDRSGSSTGGSGAERR